jgi:hypothetical protein
LLQDLLPLVGPDRQFIRADARGLPLFFPVRKNLRRVEKLLRNMSVVAEIQSAIASRLVMPEFMLTSDASNANYASTMVAEGPAMRMFDRMQQDMIEDDLGVMEHVLESAVQGGRLPATTLALVEVRAVPPTLAVRDRLQEAQADQILVRNGAMSVETMAMRNGLSPEHEQQLIARRAAVREHNFNPEEPRDERGRWTTGGSDSTIGWGPTRARGAGQGGPAGNGDSSDEKRKRDALMQDILKGLAPAMPKTTDGNAGRADANSAIFGRRTFTMKDGTTHFEAQFAGFDANGRVLLKKDDGTIVAVDPEEFCDTDKQFLNDLGKLRDDKGFMAGMKAKPGNIHLDSSGIPADRRMAWEAQVIRDIGKLNELPSGKATIDGATQQGKDITIKPRPPRSDNYASGGTVYYDPGDVNGARALSGDERPPFIGLGQELYNAEVNLSPRDLTRAEKETGGLHASKRLRSEYNQAMDDPNQREELQKRYPESSTGYPGWGMKKVDDTVLGLDGQPLP